MRSAPARALRALPTLLRIGVAETVAIGILLTGIGVGRGVVNFVGDTVPVEVGEIHARRLQAFLELEQDANREVEVVDQAVVLAALHILPHRVAHQRAAALGQRAPARYFGRIGLEHYADDPARGGFPGLELAVAQLLRLGHAAAAALGIGMQPLDHVARLVDQCLNLRMGRGLAVVRTIERERHVAGAQKAAVEPVHPQHRGDLRDGARLLDQPDAHRLAVEYVGFLTGRGEVAVASGPAPARRAANAPGRVLHGPY